MSKLLKEVYKTLAGAQKRCGFENGVAQGEFERGDTAKLYHYTIVEVVGGWRVRRDIREGKNDRP